MLDDSGVFEEMNKEDVEEVEVFSSEEDTTYSIEDFKDSAIHAELNGILDDVEEERDVNVSDQGYTSEDLSSDISENGNVVRVIYVNKSTVQNNTETVSDCQVVLLDNSQFEVLIDEISSTRYQALETTVSVNDYTRQLDDISEAIQGSLMINVIMFALCFGYFVKETVFRGL